MPYRYFCGYARKSGLIYAFRRHAFTPSDSDAVFVVADFSLRHHAADTDAARLV